jgi:hypothetical protein
MSDRAARLKLFFGGYFNQDWDAGGAESWKDVAIQYVKENPRERVLTLVDDLRSWSQQSDAGSADLPAEFGCDYDPRSDGMSDRQWVRQLAELIEKQLTS